MHPNSTPPSPSLYDNQGLVGVFVWGKNPLGGILKQSLIRDLMLTLQD